LFLLNIYEKKKAQSHISTTRHTNLCQFRTFNLSVDLSPCPVGHIMLPGKGSAIGGIFPMLQQ